MSLMCQVENFFRCYSVGILPDIESAIVGYNFWAEGIKGYGQKMFLNGCSIIRLQEPSGFKYGGGNRVRQLSLNDNWVNNGPNNFSYGQSYNYTTTDPSGAIISSGVAYEPQVGGEESALRTPVQYTQDVSMSNSYHTFIENPVMQSYYPGASVGYSKVTVTSIGKQNAIADNSSNVLSKSAEPISIYQFYTPKDFPVIQDQTDLSDDPPITIQFSIPGIYTTFKKRKARSQGYSVVLNDMAGKLKSLKVLTQPTSTNPSGNLVSEQDYKYQTISPYDPSNVNQLSDVVQVLQNDGSVTANGGYQSALIGESSDIFIDMNANKQESTTWGLDLDVDFMLPWFLYLMPFPSVAYDETSLKTVVTNKVIYKTGILQNVTTTTDESKVTQSNLAYDPNTGEPILTSITNQFNNTIYNYSYPAYWYYPGMGGAFTKILDIRQQGPCIL